MRLDHLVRVERDLAAGAARHRAAGFPVRPGGRHAGQPTRNELVPLANGPYLELLGPTWPAIPAALAVLRRTNAWPDWVGRRGAIPARFLELLARADGLADLCFAADDLTAAVDRLRGAGVDVSDPIRMERLRPDGVRLAWRLAVPADPFLPFLVADETPRADRLPPPPAPGEGALVAVRWVRVEVPDTVSAATAYAAILDGSGGVGREGPGLSPDPAAVDFDAGGVRVRLAARSDAGLAHRIEVGVLPVAGGLRVDRLPRGVHVVDP